MKIHHAGLLCIVLALSSGKADAAASPAPKLDIFRVKAISSNRILPDTNPTGWDAAAAISITMTPAEYEPATLEGCREAIDDIRYATTLSLRIEKAALSDSPGIIETAEEAEKWLSSVNVADGDLDSIREKMIRRRFITCFAARSNEKVAADAPGEKAPQACSLHVEDLFRRQRRPRPSQPIAVERGYEMASQYILKLS